MKREKKRHRTGLREHKTKAPPPEAPKPVVLEVREGRKPIRIRAETLSQAHQNPRRDAKAARRLEMTVAPVPPWVPKAEKVQVAMDQAFGGFGGYGEMLGAYGYGFGDCEAWPGFGYLAELAQRAEYRLIVETRAKEMTRKWIKLTYQGDANDKEKERIELLEAAMERFKVRDLFRQAAEHDGFFGGAQIYPNISGKSPQLPLVISPETIKKGSLKSLKCIEPFWSYPAAYNSTDPLADDFFVPQQWYVQSQTVHHTRLISLISAPVPDIIKPAYSFRGVSLTQRSIRFVDNFLRNMQSESDLLHSFSTMVLKTMLGSALQDQGAWGGIYDRVDIFNATRDNRGTMLIDKDTEELENVAVPLAGVREIVAGSMEMMAMPGQQPFVKMFGQQPTGLGANSDGEIRVYYDNIHATQEQLFGTPLKQVMDIIQLSEFGDIDDSIGIEFVALWQLDDAGKASIEKSKADTHTVYVEGGIIAPEEVREVLAKDEGGLYGGIGLKPADVPEPPEAAQPPDDKGDPAKTLGEPKEAQRSGV